MKQTLQLKLSQHLTLTPQLQQSIRLLQLSTLELNQELERFLAENPLLERDEGEDEAPPRSRLNSRPPSTTPERAEAPEKPDAPPADDERRSPDADWYLEGGGTGAAREDGDDSDYPQLAAESPSLRDHLLQQLSLTPLPEPRPHAGRAAGRRARRGRLPDAAAGGDRRDAARRSSRVEADELAIALKHLQNLDPTGVGARSPAECLELQLIALARGDRRARARARIVREHLPLLAARDFAKLKKLIGCDDASLRAAQQLIQSLNPHPGARVRADRDALRRRRRDRAQGEERLGREPQPGRDAEAAHQPHLRRHPAAEPRRAAASCRRSCRRRAG